MLSVGLWAAVAPALAMAAEKPEPSELGTGPAYETLAKLVVLHQGRVKPLDTLAREEVKQIFGFETIKLLDAAQANKVVETWAPVAALFDWTVRPEFWDEQPIILVNYLPLRRLVLADEIQARIAAIADKPSTSEADRSALKKLAAEKEISTTAITGLLARSKFPGTNEKPGEDRKALLTLAAELSEGHKWLAPKQLEDATIAGEGGAKLPFSAWFGEVVAKKRRADASATGEVKLTEVEKRGYEAGTRLVHYRALRDRDMRSVEPMLVMPRPSNKEYFAFIAKTYEKAPKVGIRGLAPLELDAAKALDTYWNELQSNERAVPGTDATFDEEFGAWLRGSSAWVPLQAMLVTPADVLAEAGYPAEKAKAFQHAFTDLEAAEAAAPGRVAEAKTQALVAAARSLGDSVNPERYPTVAAIDRETYFNETNPFWKAPVSYGLAVALLAVCLGFAGFPRGAFLGRFGRGLYFAGLIALVSGIMLEVAGFFLRVRISGWAPVTNMYETVIWVSLVSAVLGLIFELIYRKTFVALAGSGVALLGTVLAANVPLLDPNIHQLQPVLRSNYWLTIHVLTEVSSYGAFMLAAFLGLIGTIYYLTATYRRSPRFTEIALLLVPALPVFAIGLVGQLSSTGALGPNLETGNTVFLISGGMALLGGMLTLATLLAMAGEAIARLTFRETTTAEGDEPLLGGTASPRGPERKVVADASTGTGTSHLVHAGTPVQTVIVSESEREQGVVATLTKPTVAEIRSMAAAAGGKPKLDARGLAMQATAAQVKPLSNFIYRAMQVGVLLVAAGTILGGVWADYSWGRFWGWDPKEVWALITLLVYLIPLHGRFAGWINTFSLVFASVICSLSVIMAWYGVNFVLPVGLHSYGFTEGGGQMSVFAVIAAVFALPVAAAWRRSLASRKVVAAA
jgi:ABC-type transport system involved in cytochrome c biogenesis permease subunit